MEPQRQAEAGERTGDQDGDLGAFAEVAPELVEEEEDAGRQRQRAEEGGDAHAERQLLGAAVAVDVEKCGKFGEQPFVVGAYRCMLGGIEMQDARVGQAREFIPESADVVGALLCFGARGHSRFSHPARR